MNHSITQTYHYFPHWSCKSKKQSIMWNSHPCTLVKTHCWCQWYDYHNRHILPFVNWVQEPIYDVKNENYIFGYLDKSDYSLFVVEFSIRIFTHSADASWKSKHYFNIRKANFMHMIDFLLRIVHSRSQCIMPEQLQ